MFFYLFFSWILCAVAANPIVTQFAPVLAKLHARALELYVTLDNRQRAALHWALSLTAFPTVSVAYSIGVFLLMPFIYTVLITTGLLTFEKTQESTMLALERVSPALATFARAYTEQCLPKARDIVRQIDSTRAKQEPDEPKDL